MKDIGVLLDTKLYCYSQADHVIKQVIPMLGPIYCTMFYFFTFDTLVTLFCALVRSKLQSAIVAWHFVTSTESSKIERVKKVC